MPLPTSGAITLAQIQAEFGGANPISLSEYYKGGAYVSVSDTAPNVPSSGTISMSHFLGAAKAAVVGQVAYPASGIFSWIVPTGVTSICAVAIGCGGGNSNQSGGGGSLSYVNNISVTPGESLTVTVGTPTASGTPASSSIKRGATVLLNANSGNDNSVGGAADTTNGAISFAGGAGGGGGGGGGAAGYSGPGGNGGTGTGGTNNNGTSGAGGGAGGGAASQSAVFGCAGGGGTGILGQGANGAGGIATASSATGGGGGSGGTAGANAPGGGAPGSGGAYGGGIGYYNTGGAGAGAVGAVRIIWGSGRSFPSTNTGNL